MVDYYSILLRAVAAPGAGDAQWRRGIYDRSRHMLEKRLREMNPPPPAAAIAAEQSALEAAIERIESELSWTEHGAIAAERGPIAPSFALRGAVWIVLAVVAAALGAGGYIHWTQTKQKSAPPIAVSQNSIATENPGDR